jgi:glucuronate isomerase
MLYPQTPLFQRLLEQVQKLPVIDCHEHLEGPQACKPYKEPITALIQGYVQHDLESAAFGIPRQEVMQLFDPGVSTDLKWPTFEKLWRASEHTAYACMTKLVLNEFYGEHEMSRMP